MGKNERRAYLEAVIGRYQQASKKGKEFNVTAPYVTRIEQYDEITSPQFICRIADVFKVDHKALLKCAKEAKRRKFDEGLKKKYRAAVGLYRIQRKKRKSTWQA